MSKERGVGRARRVERQEKQREREGRPRKGDPSFDRRFEPPQGSTRRKDSGLKAEKRARNKRVKSARRANRG